MAPESGPDDDSGSGSGVLNCVGVGVGVDVVSGCRVIGVRDGVGVLRRSVETVGSQHLSDHRTPIDTLKNKITYESQVR
jgi:hypothetical protein